jgi:hypothetical protein
MSASNLFTNQGRSLQLIEEIALSGCIEVDSKPSVRFNPAKRPKGLDLLVREFVGMGASSLLECMLRGYAYHEGLKIVSLTNRLDIEALENTILNLPASEYCQPFPTLFVDLDVKHEVKCPQAGEEFYNEILPSSHYPDTVGIRHMPDLGVIVASVYFSSHQVITSLISTSEEGETGSGETLEESIQASFGVKMSAIDVSSDEIKVALTALRVAFNAVLILEGEGMRLLGPRNRKYYDRLTENVRKARARRDPREKVERAEQVLRAEPIYYTFDQKTIIYSRETEQGTDGPSDDVGDRRSPKSHWRSGHWRQQHYGVGNLLQKRVRIPSVLVNKHKFLGRPADSRATYEVR